MNHEDQFNRLETLLTNKSFEKLSKEEKAWILSEMTMGEYQQQRQLLLASANLHQEDLGAIPAFDSIMEHRRLQNVPKKASKEIPNWNWRNIFNHPIPIWQIALGCVFFGFVFFPVFNRPADSNEIPPPFATIQDTISEHIIKPLNGLPSKGNTIALGAKILDSNYHLYSEYIRTRKENEVFMERPLELTPIEFRPKRRNNISSDPAALNVLNNLN